MKKEEKYQFRKELLKVHRYRRNPDRPVREGEVSIDAGWTIFHEPGLEAEALDLQDYFRVSMGLDLSITDALSARQIRFRIRDLSAERGFRITVSHEAVELAGGSAAGAAAAGHYLEDLLNMRENPSLPPLDKTVSPLFSPRMVHSGWELDRFPDEYLALTAHSGFDAILLFVKGIDESANGPADFNDLIRRAAKYHIGVYFYSYLPSFKHPDEPDAEEFFDRHYGALFRHCPGAKGIILVGESCGFPSRDPETNGGRNEETVKTAEGVTDSRPAPGFWPCSDYPDWVRAVSRAIRKYSPRADIVFWTYNWGLAPLEKRLALIRGLPDDVTLEATFEMFDTITKYPNHQTVQPDYSITSPGPGYYFTTEAEAASARGMRLYAMTNTAGRTWDFGCIPYIPVPCQWIRRFRAILSARDKWGLSGLMESHHYGWTPSVVSDLARMLFRDPGEDPELLLRQIAERDFGAGAADEVLQAWTCWSDAMNSYTPGFDDQAGPLRVGPAYPFILHPILYPCSADQNMAFPVNSCAPAGAAWIHPFYQPEHVRRMTYCGRRIHEDIRIMGNALVLFEKGSRFMRDALKKVPDRKREYAEKEANVGFFCECAIRTMVHTKRWWLLNKRLEIEYDFVHAHRILQEMQSLIGEEMKNVRTAIPLAEQDSRLGYEPSMDYVCDAGHLNWKLRQLEKLRDKTLPAYAESIGLRPEM